MIVPKEKAGRLAAQLLQRYCQLGDEGRVSKGILAGALGVSRTYWSQLLKQEVPILKAHTLLSLVQAIEALQRGFDEGWLPATATRGEPQNIVARHLCVDITE